MGGSVQMFPVVSPPVRRKAPTRYLVDTGLRLPVKSQILAVTRCAGESFASWGAGLVPISEIQDEAGQYRRSATCVCGRRHKVIPLSDLFSKYVSINEDENGIALDLTDILSAMAEAARA